MAIIQAASHGTARAHVYALLSLRFAAKILYGLCFLRFYARRNRRNAPSMARFSLTCPPWQVISVLHMHNPTVSKRLRYSLNQMHMRAPWRCHGLQMLMHIYCGGLQIPHGDKPMNFASSSVTSVSLFFKVRQPAR